MERETRHVDKILKKTSTRRQFLRTMALVSAGVTSWSLYDFATPPQEIKRLSSKREAIQAEINNENPSYLGPLFSNNVEIADLSDPRRTQLDELNLAIKKEIRQEEKKDGKILTNVKTFSRILGPIALATSFTALFHKSHANDLNTKADNSLQ